ncbi:hypothetical protein [Terrabacter terrigena]|uniref:Glycosyltransferase RgtA/B/C/D-like domain-containing protein n=1 Tax=Terrabacter terrigena TaxID=574718 RepID=A0ABW3MUR0_9MICO
MTSTIATQPDSRPHRLTAADLGWLPALVVAGLASYLAPRVLVGADTKWMVALGEHVAASGSVPTGVPFAAADTAGWPNVPALGELLMYAANSLSPAALPLALIALAATTLLVLGRDAMRAGSHPAAAAGAVAVVGLGMLPVFGVVRAQMLSLVPYALLVLLLRKETRRPSQHIWLVVPLIAVWGNLHGGVLVGVALTGCYLALSRLRTSPVTALLVGGATLLSVWVNPALFRTWHYYLGVLSNEAARRGTELWARPDLRSTFDLLMVLAAIALGIAAVLKGRLRMWELCAVLGMSVATATSARHGMWLLLFLLGPAALGLTALIRRLEAAAPAPSHGTSPDRRGAGGARRGPRLLIRATTLGLAAVAAITLLGRGPALAGPVDAVDTIRSLAGDRVVLAPEPLAEDLAAAGVTVWASNPIDAFRPEDQAAYLDVWLGRQGGRRAIEASSMVVAAPTSPAYGLAVQAGCTEATRTTALAVLDCQD